MVPTALDTAQVAVVVPVVDLPLAEMAATADPHTCA
jgi:hypothetical protein